MNTIKNELINAVKVSTAPIKIVIAERLLSELLKAKRFELASPFALAGIVYSKTNVNISRKRVMELFNEIRGGE